jgi:hypothetical protein
MTPLSDKRCGTFHLFFGIKIIMENSNISSSKPFVSKDETSAIDESRFSKIITAPDWKIPAKALDEALKDWLESQKVADPFRVIKGSPFSGHAKILILIPQAFQTEQMTDFLTGIISGGSEKRMVFRKMGDGKLILVPHLLTKSKSQSVRFLRFLQSVQFIDKSFEKTVPVYR